MEAERNVTLQKIGKIPVALTDDTRCPYTLGEDWDGACYDGKECKKPYLDFVLSIIPQNYCRQKEAPLWWLELVRKNEPLFTER